MPPKTTTRTKKWSKADNHKLEQLVHQPGNNINTSNSKRNVALVIEYWPERKKNVKSFGALVHPKLQQLELEGHCVGGRAAPAGGGELCLVLFLA
jgi:hypothetical protein